MKTNPETVVPPQQSCDQKVSSVETKNSTASLTTAPLIDNEKRIYENGMESPRPSSLVFETNDKPLTKFSQAPQPTSLDKELRTPVQQQNPERVMELKSPDEGFSSSPEVHTPVQTPEPKTPAFEEKSNPEPKSPFEEEKRSNGLKTSTSEEKPSPEREKTPSWEEREFPKERPRLSRGTSLVDYLNKPDEPANKPKKAMEILATPSPAMVRHAISRDIEEDTDVDLRRLRRDILRAARSRQGSTDDKQSKSLKRVSSLSPGSVGPPLLEKYLRFYFFWGSCFVFVTMSRLFSV